MLRRAKGWKIEDGKWRRLQCEVAANRSRAGIQPRSERPDTETLPTIFKKVMNSPWGEIHTGAVVIKGLDEN